MLALRQAFGTTSIDLSAWTCKVRLHRWKPCATRELHCQDPLYSDEPDAVNGLQNSVVDIDNLCSVFDSRGVSARTPRLDCQPMHEYECSHVEVTCP
jgi:hypothetical protein